MFILLRLALGIIQFCAITSGLESWWGIHWFFSSFISLALCILCWPLALVLGFMGAVSAWGWSYLSAALLFFPFLILSIVIGGGALSIAGLSKLMNNK